MFLSDIRQKKNVAKKFPISAYSVMLHWHLRDQDQHPAHLRHSGGEGDKAGDEKRDFAPPPTMMLARDGLTVE